MVQWLEPMIERIKHQQETHKSKLPTHFQAQSGSHSPLKNKKTVQLKILKKIIFYFYPTSIPQPIFQGVSVFFSRCIIFCVPYTELAPLLEALRCSGQNHLARGMSWVASVIPGGSYPCDQAITTLDV